MAPRDVSLSQLWADYRKTQRLGLRPGFSAASLSARDVGGRRAPAAETEPPQKRERPPRLGPPATAWGLRTADGSPFPSSVEVAIREMKHQLEEAERQRRQAALADPARAEKDRRLVQALAQTCRAPANLCPEALAAHARAASQKRVKCWVADGGAAAPPGTPKRRVLRRVSTPITPETAWSPSSAASTAFRSSPQSHSDAAWSP